MKQYFKVAAIVTTLSFTQAASASIGISFNALAENGTSVNLAAGTYTGTWTGGGWSAWITGDYWLNAFYVTTTEGTSLFGTDSSPNWYVSPAAALDAVNGMTFNFNVPTQQAVKFTVADGPGAFYDNRGSLSISIAPVPEPETYAMFLAGLGLIGAIARRKKFAA